jgi:hypothetical protein
MGYDLRDVVLQDPLNVGAAECCLMMAHVGKLDGLISPCQIMPPHFHSVGHCNINHGIRFAEIKWVLLRFNSRPFEFILMHKQRIFPFHYVHRRLIRKRVTIPHSRSHEDTFVVSEAAER